MAAHPFIIVSNRLPVSVRKEHGTLVFQPSSGGLATAMSSLGGNAPHLWVGWPGIAADDLTAQDKTLIIDRLREFKCYPVFLTRQEIKLFYDGYANSTIWPLFHYFQSYVQFDQGFWAAYKSANERFAAVIARLAQQDGTVWIHDYHLMLLPQLIRKRLPHAAIGFFLHIPFPTFEVFRLLPDRRDILEGLLGADLVGFHTYDYAHYFMSSVRRVLGRQIQSGAVLLDDRTVIVDAFPIGIDYAKFSEAMALPAVLNEAAILEQSYKGKQLILSVDRLDYTKGILERLSAFDQFLEMHPAHHKHVCLVVVAIPSRTEVASYQKLREEIEHSISRINGTYGTADWTPVSYQFKNLPFEQVAALYERADIALVTPLRDGMNLVAKEYVASKQQRTGVLILSEFAGAADELQEAIRVNPNDVSSIVSAMSEALTMPKRAQRQRLQAMQQRIAHYTVQRWADDFAGQLQLARQLRSQQHKAFISETTVRRILTAYAQAAHRTFLLDYDGTLKAFVNTPDPDSAAPSKALCRILQNLAAQPNTDVSLISGRTREALDSWFPHTALTLVAEHGAWIRSQAQWTRGVAVSNTFKGVIRPLLEHYAERTPGALVEEKDFALVWHYRNVPPELAYARNLSLKHELRNALAGTGIGIFDGNKVVEIKPFSIQKGTIVHTLLDNRPADFILSAGDDYTDEDMFTALPADAYSIKVGAGSSHARFQIASVPALLSLLRRIAAI